MTYLRQVKKLLDLPPAEKSEVLRELESHMADIQDELIASGTDASTAEIEAERRMGSPEDVALRINAAHNTASWKSAFLTALPFVAALLVLLFPQTGSYRSWFTLAACLGTAAGSIRELVRGRRPIWLSSWLAGAMFSAASLVHQVLNYATDPSVIVDKKATIISGLGLAALFLISSFVTSRGRLRAVIFSGIYLVCTVIFLRNGLAVVNTLDDAKAIPIIAGLALMPIMLVMFACNTFKFHPYGSAIRASLFLLSSCSFAYFANIKQFNYAVVGILLPAAIVICVARAKTRDLKVKALKIGVFLLAVISALFDPSLVNLERSVILIIVSITLTTAIYFYVLYCFVLFPVWSEKLSSSADLPLAVE